MGLNQADRDVKRYSRRSVNFENDDVNRNSPRQIMTVIGPCEGQRCSAHISEGSDECRFLVTEDRNLYPLEPFPYPWMLNLQDNPNQMSPTGYRTKEFITAKGTKTLFSRDGLCGRYCLCISCLLSLIVIVPIIVGLLYRYKVI